MVELPDDSIDEKMLRGFDDDVIQWNQNIEHMNNIAIYNLQILLNCFDEICQHLVGDLSAPEEPASDGLDAACDPDEADPVKDLAVPGYLGLLLDRDTLVAGRAGYEAKVEFATTTLQWYILLKLEKSRQNFCHRDIISYSWGEAGREEKPRGGAIYEAISKLRSRLKPKLGLAIKNLWGGGWRLEDIYPVTTAPPD